jgi:hypothetical protein
MSEATAVERTEERSESSGTEIHIKGEMHSSRADHEEERELMKAGVDALVMEGQEGPGEYSVLEGWFYQAKTAMFYILSPLYMSKELFLDVAALQDADVYFTRESDAEVLRNAPVGVRALAAALYYLLVPASIVTGVATGNYVTGATVLALGFFVPVLLLRLYNMYVRGKGKNRDQLMAETITKAAAGNESVLAIVGASHADGVREALSDELDVTYHPPVYGRVSRGHLRDIAVPMFQMFSLLLTLYVVVLWGSMTILGQL